VPAAGGAPAPLTTLDEGQVTQRFPQMLPGGRAVLFMQHSSTGGYEEAHLVVQELPAGPRKVIVRGGYFGRYVASGHVLYVHEGTMFAVPFDVRRLEVSGEATPVLEGLMSGPGGGAQMAVSASGTLVYRPGASTVSQPSLQWLRRDGKVSVLSATADWSAPAFAPDGRRLAFDINDGKQISVWVYDWQRDTMSRLSTVGTCVRPVWTPDGHRIVSACLSPGVQGAWALTLQNADGTGEAVRLFESKVPVIPSSWHPDGKSLAYMEGPSTGGTGWDAWIVRIEGDEASGWKAGTPAVFLKTASLEQEPMFSPDGKWLAYVSDETGRPEVYVRAFPGPGGKWPISTGGGHQPTWSRTRNELIFTTLAPGYQFMAVPYSAPGGVFAADKPRAWAAARFRLRVRPTPSRYYDVHPDGDRLAFAMRDNESTGPDHVVFVLNFVDELQRRAVAGR
jgi:serine/threonine-protein kinase